MSAGSHAFLGQEFLTWLWWKFETEGGEFTLSRGREVAVSLEDMIQFQPSEGFGTACALTKGLPSRAKVARVALAQGQRVAKARLAIAQGDRVWLVTIVGATLALTAIKPPEDEEDLDTAPARTEERVGNLLDLQEIVAELYRVFLKERLAPGYLKGAAEAQAAWMAGGAA